MRLVKILGFTALLGLAGCFESDLSVGTVSEQGFVLSDRARFESKIILRAAPGKYGPMFLETYGLVGTDSAGTTYQFGGLFPYGLINPSTPWIDSELWVDYLVGSPTLAFWDLRSLSHASGYGAENWLDLTQCADLPKSVFQTAKDSGINPIEYLPILRVGRYLFLSAQNPTPGVNFVSRAGIAIVRMGDIARRTEDCSKFEDPNAVFAAKWVDLHPYHFDALDTTSIRGRIMATLESESGIYVSYWTQGDSGSSYIDRTYLAFVDTTGSTRILDSSSTSYYFSLFKVGNRTWAIDDGYKLSELPSPDAPPIRTGVAWSAVAYPPCMDIQGRCVLRSADLLFDLDTSTLALKSLDTRGLEGNQITGVVQYKDTVYVSTLSGVFTKPVARFFGPAE